MSLSGVISGIALCIIGFFIIASGFFKDSPMFIFILIGILFIGTGIYMIVNTSKEDRIEEIRKK